jgi:hypothetical protein
VKPKTNDILYSKTLKLIYNWANLNSGWPWLASLTQDAGSNQISSTQFKPPLRWLTEKSLVLFIH